MNVLSLFSGIGGLDLGLERAGMTIAGQVEIDPWCRKVLAKHWPEVPRHDDVRTAVDWWRSTDRPAVGLIAGGFPCQPVSVAGERRAQADDRWLWPAMAALIGELRPDYALMENVPGLLSAGMGDVLGDLASIGYDAEWDCVPAAAVGARHQRDRVWIVAYPAGVRSARIKDATARNHADRAHARREEETGRTASGREALAGSDRQGQLQQARCFGDIRRRPRDCGWWTPEPELGRVAYGVPAWVDRIGGLGNAVVPQVAEHIGRLIIGAAA